MGNKKIKFSIIVPTRNRHHSLRHTLMKIKEQSWKDFEVIVVDDGSSMSLNKYYKDIWLDLDDRFCLHECARESQAGSGASISRNFGISCAKGEFVGFCDDDDYWCDPRHLEFAAIALTESDGELYVANQVAMLGETVFKKEWLSDIGVVLKKRTKSHLFDGYILKRQDFLKIWTFPQLNMLLVKREIVDLVKGFWSQIRYLEDLDFFLRVLDKTNVVIYRSETVCVHNIPDRVARKGLVEPLSRLDKCTLWLCVSHHVRATCETKELRKKCKQIEGRWLYNYSVELANQKKWHAGLLPALQALLLAPSPTKLKNFCTIAWGGILFIIKG